MFTRIKPEKTETMVFCRRCFGLAALAFGTVAIRWAAPSTSQFATTGPRKRRLMALTRSHR